MDDYERMKATELARLLDQKLSEIELLVDSIKRSLRRIEGSEQ